MGEEVSGRQKSEGNEDQIVREMVEKNETKYLHGKIANDLKGLVYFVGRVWPCFRDPFAGSQKKRSMGRGKKQREMTRERLPRLLPAPCAFSLAN